MKEQMKYVTEHAEEIDKLSKVQAQVTQVQNIMRENIDKVYIILNLHLFVAFQLVLWSLDLEW